MSDFITFEDALKKAGRRTKNLLLGNGFSQALSNDLFSYKSLFESDKLSESKEIKKVFDAFETSNFEEVMEYYEYASKIFPFYCHNRIQSNLIISHMKELRSIFIKSINEIHPRTTKEIKKLQHIACKEFLSKFIGIKGENLEGKIFTLNYDLLLYWALLYGEDKRDGTIKLNFNDGFSKKIEAPEKLIWQGTSLGSKQNIFYLHGALHLFDDESGIIKCAWKPEESLIENIEKEIQHNNLPVFIAEGNSDKKKTRIRHHVYLNDSFNKFSDTLNKKESTLFIFGFSFSQSDEHIFKEIQKSKIEEIFISVYEDGNLKNKAEEFKNRVRSIMGQTTITFFDAKSAKVWNG